MLFGTLPLLADLLASLLLFLTFSFMLFPTFAVVLDFQACLAVPDEINLELSVLVHIKAVL